MLSFFSAFFGWIRQLFDVLDQTVLLRFSSSFGSYNLSLLHLLYGFLIFSAVISVMYKGLKG